MTGRAGCEDAALAMIDEAVVVLAMKKRRLDFCKAMGSRLPAVWAHPRRLILGPYGGEESAKAQH